MTTESGASHFTPPKKTMMLEFSVGLFTLAGVLCFAYLAVHIAKMNFFQSGYHDIGAEFSNISGLELGAPVEIAGVPVGEVTGIQLKDTAAIVTMSIRNEVSLRDDDIASIRTKGIIGDRYVKIVPGGSEKMIPVGGSVRDTESAVDLEEIVGKLIHRME